MSDWQVINSVPNEIVVWGAGDQSSVDIPIIKSLGLKIVAFIDETQGIKSPIESVPIFQSGHDFSKWYSMNFTNALGSVVAIGNPNSKQRYEYYEILSKLGIKPTHIVDRTACIRFNAKFEDGLQVMPKVIVNNDVTIGKYCILNTAAIVEHHCNLGNGVEIGPGAILTGRVTVGDHSWVGAGVTVLPRLTIGSNVIIGAGSVVTKDVPDNAIVVGSPARLLRFKSIPIKD
jgi:sugar O-acyltransferase (sialic acid O-acetyltransferase NeuD family)